MPIDLTLINIFNSRHFISVGLWQAFGPWQPLEKWAAILGFEECKILFIFLSLNELVY